MPLICRETNQALHRRGHDMLSGFRNGKTPTPYKIETKDEKKPIIPELEVFRDDEPPATGRKPSHSGVLPNVAQCAIHLEFLETLFVLREKILRSDDIDKAMDIQLQRQRKTGFKGDTKELKDTTLETRRRAKWPKYIELAVIRFLDWQESLPKDAGPDIKLPPLDVLMVWHAFLLNPLMFHTHCRDKPIYNIPFPWEAIHACINNDDWSFRHPDRKGSSTCDLYGLLCKWKRTHILTTVPDSIAKDLLASSFSLSSLPHEDSLSTLARCVDEIDPSMENPILLLATMARNLRASTNYLPPLDTMPPTPSTLPLVSVPPGPENNQSTDVPNKPKPETTLAKELFDAVLRQNSFIDKMSHHLWIRSPALKGTLRRSIERYSKFLQLQRLDTKITGRREGEKKTMLVPTLDIDLAWHTHQCSGGRAYMMATRTLVGRFINHDDKIGDGDLADGSAETRRLWRLRFGSEYRTCLCWDCEMLLDQVEAAVQNATENGINMKEIGARVEKEVTYYRAVEAARRNKKALPKKLELE
ncbi:Protein of unknown function (DUF1399) domain containing protein [Naviculisporaceae sp. PSN 640]